MSTPGPRADARATASDWLFFASLWLAMVLVGLKAVYLGIHAGFSLREIGYWLQSLAAISHADLVFVVALWLCGRAMVAVAGTHRWISSAILALWMSVAAAVCLYAVA